MELQRGQSEERLGANLNWDLEWMTLLSSVLCKGCWSHLYIDSRLVCSRPWGFSQKSVKCLAEAKAKKAGQEG